MQWSVRAVVSNLLDCDIVENEFELQSCYYVHFRTNTQEKGMNCLIPLAMDQIAQLTRM